MLVGSLPKPEELKHPNLEPGRGAWHPGLSLQAPFSPAPLCSTQTSKLEIICWVTSTSRTSHAPHPRPSFVCQGFGFRAWYAPCTAPHGILRSALYLPDPKSSRNETYATCWWTTASAPPWPNAVATAPGLLNHELSITLTKLAHES